MLIKNGMFAILVSLITIDIVLTNLFVIFFGAAEINPLCINFSTFMIIKIIVSIVLLYITYKIKTIPYWIVFIVILIIIYTGLLLFNLNSIVNYFFL